MKDIEKNLFAELDKDIIKSASKKDKKEKKKKKALSDSKFSKKLLGSIKSSELKEAFKKQKNLLDDKKFWSRD